MAVNGSNYFTVTVDSTQVDADLTDFPVYVNLDDLAGAHGFWSNVKTDGADIRVTKSDGTTEVPFELVDIDTGAETGELHFKASGTLSSTSNTEYRVYYNSTDTAYAASATFGRNNVWTAYNYASHDGGGVDSTGNHSDGTGAGSVTIGGATGQIGSATQFDGTDDEISVSSPTFGMTDGSSDIVAGSMWINSDANQSTLSGSQVGFVAITDEFFFGVSVTDEEVTIGTYGGNVDGQSNEVLPNGTWKHYYFEYDESANTGVIYADGDSTLSGTLSDDSNSTTNDFLIGGFKQSGGGSNNSYFDGLIDEVRMSTSKRTADQLSTEFNNQSSSSTFYALSAEQSVSANPANTRFTAEYTTINTNDNLKVYITDSSFSGTVKELDGTGSDWFTDSLQRINVKQPLESRIQNRQISVSLWVEEEQFITDLFSSTEGRFKLLYDKNSSREWEGFILPDLCSYEEREADLWKLTIVAKDFSVLEGDDFGSTVSDGDARVTIIESIAGILSENYDLDIYTHTSWIVDGTTTTTDFMSQIYIDEYGIREFGRTGDEENELLSLKEALDRILKACGCVIRQVSGRFYIQQITALDDPTSVRENVYNSAGVFQSQNASVDLTNTLKPLRSSNNEYNPGIKSARLKYEHRSTVTVINFPQFVSLADDDLTRTFSQFFVGTGSEQIQLSGTVRGFTTTNVTDGRVELIIKSGTLYYDGTNWNTTSSNVVSIPLENNGDQDGANYIYDGSINLTTAVIPQTNSGNIEITLQNAVIEASPDEAALETEYTGLEYNILGSTAVENSVSIDYKLTQSADQSVKVNYGKIFFGDGPAASSRGGFTTDSAGQDPTNNVWELRGGTTYANHARVVLREFLDVQRSSRRRISSVIKDSLDWVDVINYDSTYFYNLGGTFNGYTGDYNTESFELNIISASDTFEDLPKYLPEGAISAEPPSSGTSPTEGITEGEADALYFQQVNNLSEGNASSMRTNLGLVIGTDVQAHSSALDDYSSNSLTASELDQLQNINSVTILNSQWGYLGALNQGLATTNSPTFDNLSLTGALDSGTITSGFGSIDVGTNSIAGSVLIADAGAPRLDLKESNTTDQNVTLALDAGIFQLQVRNDAGSATSSPFVYDIPDAEFRFGDITRFNDNIFLAGANADIRFVADDDSVRNYITGDHETTTSDDEIVIGSRYGSVSLATGQIGSETNYLTLNNSGTIDIASDATIAGKLTHNASIESDNFDLGTGSTGWIVDGADGFGAIDNSGNYHLYTDDLTVRGTLKVFELIAKQISAIGGSEILSIANGVADSVVNGAGSEVVTMEDPVGGNAVKFADGDLCVIQRFDPNSTTLVKSEWRTVTVVSGLNVTFTSTTGAPAPSDAIEGGDFIVVYGNNGDTAGRDNIIYRNVEGNPIVRLQSGIDSYSDFNSPSATTQVAYGDLNGLVTGISSEEFGVAAGDMTLAGNHFLLTDTQGSLQFDTFKLESDGLAFDSSVGRKIKVDDAGENIISIGDFDFGAFEESTTAETGTNSTTSTPFTDATAAATSTIVSVGQGSMTSPRSEDGNIADASIDFTGVAGKWARIQFDWSASGVSGSRVPVGYTIAYPNGRIEELSRSISDTTDSGSVDTGYIFFGDSANGRISLTTLAPAGGLTTGEDHQDVIIDNITVTTVDNDYTYTEIGNTGFRSYNSGGRNAIDFTGGSGELTVTSFNVGSWNFAINADGDLEISNGATVVQTFDNPNL